MGSFLPFARLRCTGSHILVQGSKVDAVPILDLKGKDCASTIQPWFQAIPSCKWDVHQNQRVFPIAQSRSQPCWTCSKLRESLFGSKDPNTRKWFAVQQATRPQWHSSNASQCYIWWFGTWLLWDVILPIDELIFFKMVETTNQIGYIYIYIIYPSPIWYHAEMTPLEATPRQQFIPFHLSGLTLPRLGTGDTKSQMLIIIHWIILNHIESYQYSSQEYPFRWSYVQPWLKRTQGGYTMTSHVGATYFTHVRAQILRSKRHVWLAKCDSHPSARKPWAILKKRGYHNCYSNS